MEFASAFSSTPLKPSARCRSYAHLTYRRPKLTTARVALSKLPAVFRHTLKQQKLLQPQLELSSKSRGFLGKRFSQPVMQGPPTFGKPKKLACALPALFTVSKQRTRLRSSLVLQEDLPEPLISM